MAKTWHKTSLKLVYSYMNDEGEQAKKSKTYSNVRQNAEESDVYETAETLASLQQYRLEEVQEVVINLLSE